MVGAFKFPSRLKGSAATVWSAADADVAAAAAAALSQKLFPKSLT